MGPTRTNKWLELNPACYMTLVNYGSQKCPRGIRHVTLLSSTRQTLIKIKRRKEKEAKDFAVLCINLSTRGRTRPSRSTGQWSSGLKSLPRREVWTLWGQHISWANLSRPNPCAYKLAVFKAAQTYTSPTYLGPGLELYWAGLRFKGAVWYSSRYVSMILFWDLIS